MFEKIFGELIEKGVLIKTKYSYMINNQGEYIYKCKHGKKTVFKNALKQVGCKILKDKTSEVDVVYYNGHFIGCLESSNYYRRG